MAGDPKVSLIMRLIDRVTAPLRKITNNFEVFRRNAKKAAKLFDISADMKHAADGMQEFSAGVVKAVRGPIEAAAELEQALKRVEAITFGGERTEETVRRMAPLTEEIRRLGSVTKFEAYEVADAAKALATAGFTAEQQTAALEGVVSLAAAGEVEMARAAEIAAIALKDFGLDAGEMGRVSDALVKTFTSTNTTIDGIAEAMKYVGPEAHRAGVEVETLVAMIGKLGDAGIQGSQAGTTLRKTISSLAAPSKQAKKYLDFLGIKTKDKMGNLRPPEHIFAEMGDAMDKAWGVGKGGAKRSRVLKEVFGEEAMTGAGVLVQASQSGALQQQTKDTIAATGISGKIAAMQMEGAAGALKEFDSALSELKITIGNSLLPEVTNMVKAIKDWTAALTELTSEHPVLVKGTMGAAAGVAGLIGVVAVGTKAVAAATAVWAALTWGVGAAKTAMIFFSGVFKSVTAFMVANPIVAIVLAIAAAATLIYIYWEPISEFFSNLWAGITEAAGAAWGKISEWGTGAWDGIKAAAGATLDWITEKIEWVTAKLEELSEWTSTLTGLFNPFESTSNLGGASAMIDQVNKMTAAANGPGSPLDQAAAFSRVAEAANSSKYLSSILPRVDPPVMERTAPVLTPETREMLDRRATGTDGQRFDGELTVKLDQEGRVTGSSLRASGSAAPNFRVKATGYQGVK